MPKMFEYKGYVGRLAVNADDYLIHGLGITICNSCIAAFLSLLPYKGCSFASIALGKREAGLPLFFLIHPISECIPSISVVI